MWTEVEVVERCTTERGELVLQRRGSDFEIISNGTFLMATYNGESERQLVQAALQRVKNPSRVLVGGLGVGFTLQEALKDERVQQVDVFEIEPKIVEWNQRLLGELAQQAVADGRTSICLEDLVAWVHATPDESAVPDESIEMMDHSSTGNQSITNGEVEPNVRYDVICLDIDNGSDWTVHDTNASLYSRRGMEKLGQRLNPGGALTFWNARRDTAFEAQLAQHFHAVDFVLVEHPVGEPDVVYIVQDPVMLSQHSDDTAGAEWPNDCA